MRISALRSAASQLYGIEYPFDPAEFAEWYDTVRLPVVKKYNEQRRKVHVAMREASERNADILRALADR
jgi:hypothetical protein